MAGPSLIDAPRPRLLTRRRLKARRRSECLDADTLKAMQHSVAEGLRRIYGESPNAAVETAAEMVNEAYAEWAEKPETERAKVRNLPGLLVTNALHRSVDKARRERRELHGEAAEAAIEGAADQAPSTEALAVRGIEAAEVFEAVAELHQDQRRALMLIYWEELNLRDAAARMGVGTMTVSRRRDDAMAALRRRFGVDADDPINEHLEKVAGYHAWTIFVIGPAAVHAAASVTGDQLAAGASTIRHGFSDLIHGAAGLPGRARDFAARMVSSGGGETVGRAVASGSAGNASKVLGVCAAGTLAVCGAAGLAGIGPGAGLLHPGGDQSARKPGARATVNAAPRVQSPTKEPIHNAPLSALSATRSSKSARPSTARPTHHLKHRTDSSGRTYTPAADRAVSSQTLSGETEPASTEPPPTEVPEEPSEPYVGEPGSGGEDTATGAAAAQFGP